MVHLKNRIRLREPRSNEEDKASCIRSRALPWSMAGAEMVVLQAAEVALKDDRATQ